jgi:hypothetical protein
MTSRRSLRRICTRRWIPSFCGVALAAASAMGQSIWRVDGRSFDDVASAYAVAAPGDTILVSRPAARLGYLNGKGVRIVASQRGLLLDGAGSGITNIPYGQQLVLSGFAIDAPFGAWSPIPLRIHDCPGSVVLEDCDGVNQIDPYSYGLNGLRFDRCADVQLFGVSWSGRNAGRLGSTICTSSYGGGSAGVYVYASTATLVRCRFRGGDSAACPWYYCFGACQPASIPGGAAILAEASRISAHECELRGGRGSSSTTTPAIDGGAIDLRTGSEAWITPTPTQPVFAEAGTLLRSFGATPIVIGSGVLVAESRALPRLEAELVGLGLRIRARWQEPGAPLFVGVSFSSGFVPLDPYGHLGILQMDYDRARSLLLATGNLDASGAFETWLAVPHPPRLGLPQQALRFQLLTLDSAARIAVSGVDFLVAPAYG